MYINYYYLTQKQTKMSTEAEVIETTETAAETQTLNALQESAFGSDAPIETVAETVETVNDAPIAEQATDTNTFLKNKWGWDNEEAADTEIKSLREKAEKNFEFKNEDSKKVAEYIIEGKEDDLYAFLDNKKKVEKLSTANVEDINVAAQLVKFDLRNANKNLNEDEIDFLFNEKYATPEKPIQGEFEEDDDYNSKVKIWEKQVSNIEKRMIIEAKMAQPKLAQLKSELVLPNISKESSQVQPTQEDLTAAKEQQDSFIKFAESKAKDFTGFSVQVKDKDVNYTVSYAPSQEEKTLVTNKLKEFAESGFNANALLADRWVAEDGKTIKVEKMVKDLSRLYADDKATQKLVLDASNKRIEAYLKEKKQINVNGLSQNGQFNPSNNTTVLDEVREAACA
jgi:hypothetical protein